MSASSSSDAVAFERVRRRRRRRRRLKLGFVTIRLPRSPRLPGWVPRPSAPVVLLITAGVAIVVLVSASRVADARQDLQMARVGLLAAKDAVAAVDPDAASAELERAEQLLLSARRKSTGFPLGQLGAVPLVGSPGRAARDAADAGLDVVVAGKVLADAVETFPTSGKVGIDGHDLSAFHTAARGSGGAVREAETHLRAAAEHIDGAMGAMLPMVSSSARELGHTVDDAIHQLDGARRGLALLADLTAPTTDARILVLSQDTMELRATGGFIGSFGVIHFRHGTVELERYDSFDVLPPPDPPMSAPPQLARMLPRWWGISNVNWWPDFPTTASTAREMFQRQRGGRIDGVLAITEDVLAGFLGAIGPVEVPGYPEPVQQEGFADRVLHEVELKRPADTPKKRFLIELSMIVFDRLFALPSSDVRPVVEAVSTSASSGSVQVWFEKQQRQELIAGSGFSGALPETDGDFLMLVDSNLTASKANRDLVRDIDYHVRRDPTGELTATLTIRTSNNGPESVVNTFYNGFLRVYAPRGAVLLEGSDYAEEVGPAERGPYQVFGIEVAVAPESSKSVTVRYRLPATILDDGEYRLTWIRQSGTPNDRYGGQVGGRRIDAPTGAERVINFETKLGGNRVMDFLRTRWIVRQFAS